MTFYILPRTDVTEILRIPPPHLTPRQLEFLRALCVPDRRRQKEIAHAMGVTHGTLKVYVSQIYRKLGWTGGGCLRTLVLWAIANREMLGIALPTPEQCDR